MGGDFTAGGVDAAQGALKIRVLREWDVGFADTLRSLAGWNQTAQEWERRIRLEPEGCFLGEWNGVPVATATTTYYGPHLAWIGMFLVHPGYRRLGIGAALLCHCIHHLRSNRGVACVKLDATPAGQPLYLRHGFEPETELTRWQRTGVGSPQAAGALPQHVPHISESDFNGLVELDAAAFGCARGDLLRASIGDALEFVQMRGAGGRCKGYGLLRSGSRAYYLGPIVARTARQAEGIALNLLSKVGDGPVFWDLFDQNRAAVDLARALGFSAQRPLVRMHLGPTPGSGQLRWQWGILDPATG